VKIQFELGPVCKSLHSIWGNSCAFRNDWIVLDDIQFVKIEGTSWHLMQLIIQVRNREWFRVNREGI
jgi:hypothetical protein